MNKINSLSSDLKSCFMQLSNNNNNNNNNIIIIIIIIRRPFPLTTFSTKLENHRIKSF